MISASCVTDTIAVYYGYDCRVLRIVFITSVGIIGCLFFVRWPQNYFANCLELNEKSHIFANRNRSIVI